MASLRSNEQLSLDNYEYAQAWLRILAVKARTKKLKDSKSIGGENQITDLLLTTSGCEAIIKLSAIARPRELGKMISDNISQ